MKHSFSSEHKQRLHYSLKGLSPNHKPGGRGFRAAPEQKGVISVRILLGNLLILVFLTWDGAANTAICKTAARVGILPFQIYSGEKVEYLQEIVSTRLSNQLKKEEQIEQEKTEHPDTERAEDDEH